MNANLQPQRQEIFSESEENDYLDNPVIDGNDIHYYLPVTSPHNPRLSVSYPALVEIEDDHLHADASHGIGFRPPSKRISVSRPIHHSQHVYDVEEEELPEPKTIKKFLTRALSAILPSSSDDEEAVSVQGKDDDRRLSRRASWSKRLRNSFHFPSSFSLSSLSSPKSSQPVLEESKDEEEEEKEKEAETENREEVPNGKSS